MLNFGLTNIQIIELRLKCIAPYITIASKANIEDQVVFKKAEEAWNYAVKPLLEKSNTKTPDESQPSTATPKP